MRGTGERPIQSADLRRVTDDLERRRELVETGLALPAGLLRHQLSISRICTSDSGVVEPPGSPTLTQLVENCRCRSELSGFSRVPGRDQVLRAEPGVRRPVRSSSSSSATRSTTVPSGSVVGSSSTSLPFSTRARRGLMALLYGFPKRPATQRVIDGFGGVVPALVALSGGLQPLKRLANVVQFCVGEHRVVVARMRARSRLRGARRRHP